MTPPEQARPLVFVDIETTGLSLKRDQVWEIAAIRRDPDTVETVLKLFVDHNPRLCAKLPEPFLSDHLARFPIDCRTGRRRPSDGTPVYTPTAAAARLCEFFTDDVAAPTMVCAVPTFDEARLHRLLWPSGFHDPWHYRTRDVESMVMGKLGLTDVPGLRRAAELVGVHVDDTTRHTALGDARLVRDVFDAVIGGAAPGLAPAALTDPLTELTQARERIAKVLAAHEACHDETTKPWGCMWGHGGLSDGMPDQPAVCTTCCYDDRVVLWPCPTAAVLIGAEPGGESP